MQKVGNPECEVSPALSYNTMETVCFQKLQCIKELASIRTKRHVEVCSFCGTESQRECLFSIMASTVDRYKRVLGGNMGHASLFEPGPSAAQVPGTHLPGSQ